MKKIPGEYIDTTKVVQSIKPIYTAVADSKEIKEALYLMTLDKDAVPVNLTLSGGQIYLRRESKDGKAVISVSANIPVDTPESGFYYNADSLYKLLQVIGGRVRLEINGKGMMMVKSVNEVYVQMPQRPPVMKKTEAA